MTLDETITQWIDDLREGNSDAAELLWQEYFHKLVTLARRKLEKHRLRFADEEDVALSAFKSFCIGAREGRFPKLTDRDSLWSLLVVITSYKSTDLIRYENCQKRGGKRRRAHVSYEDIDVERLNSIIQAQPTPEFAAQLGEQLEFLLSKLDRAEDANLIKIALAKMQGESTADIALQLGCARRTVERKLTLIRRIWDNECS